MDSILRDIDREQSKMQADVDNLNRHYGKLAGFVGDYIKQATIEWAKLVVSHPKALLLVMETTRIVEDRHIIIFGADWARSALQSAYHTHVLDNAFCLQNKCKEYYNQFYDLGLEKILSYQGIDKRRDELRDSRDRLLMLARVANNLAAGMQKQSQESEISDSLGDLSDHPF